MRDPIQLTVEAHAARQRLDHFLAASGLCGSRARVQRLIAAGHVRLDGAVPKPSAMVKAGQRVTVEPVQAPEPAAVEPEDIALEVLFEDEWLLVINKPPGLVVHPAPGHWHGTLVAALLHHWRGPRPGLDPLRPGIVHRLDKDTSGVLVIAKDADALADLGAQFRRREVEKEYLAVVWGHLRQEKGSMTRPIGRDPVHRKRMAVRAGGRVARTEYAVVERYARATLVRAFPHTGRTHQIRVHFAAAGHPIVGDVLYGRRRDAALPMARQALHAAQITFRHPHTQQRVTFRAPLPADLQALRAAARAR